MIQGGERETEKEGRRVLYEAVAAYRVCVHTSSESQLAMIGKHTCVTQLIFAVSTMSKHDSWIWYCNFNFSSDWITHRWNRRKRTTSSYELRERQNYPKKKTITSFSHGCVANASASELHICASAVNFKLYSGSVSLVIDIIIIRWRHLFDIRCAHSSSSWNSASIK